VPPPDVQVVPSLTFVFASTQSRLVEQSRVPLWQSLSAGEHGPSLHGEHVPLKQNSADPQLVPSLALVGEPQTGPVLQLVNVAVWHASVLHESPTLQGTQFPAEHTCTESPPHAVPSDFAPPSLQIGALFTSQALTPVWHSFAVKSQLPPGVHVPPVPPVPFVPPVEASGPPPPVPLVPLVPPVPPVPLVPPVPPLPAPPSVPASSTASFNLPVPGSTSVGSAHTPPTAQSWPGMRQSELVAQGVRHCWSGPQMSGDVHCEVRTHSNVWVSFGSLQTALDGSPSGPTTHVAGAVQSFVALHAVWQSPKLQTRFESQSLFSVQPVATPFFVGALLEPQLMRLGAVARTNETASAFDTARTHPANRTFAETDMKPLLLR
jgi:hypothetical protein